MAENKKPAEPTAPTNKELEIIRQKLEQRYQELNRACSNEPNIALRYDLKIRIDELAAIFSLIFNQK